MEDPKAISTSLHEYCISWRSPKAYIEKKTRTDFGVGRCIKSRVVLDVRLYMSCSRVKEMGPPYTPVLGIYLFRFRTEKTLGHMILSGLAFSATEWRSGSPVWSRETETCRFLVNDCQMNHADKSLSQELGCIVRFFWCILFASI